MRGHFEHEGAEFARQDTLFQFNIAIRAKQIAMGSNHLMVLSDPNKVIKLIRHETHQDLKFQDICCWKQFKRPTWNRKSRKSQKRICEFGNPSLSRKTHPNIRLE